MVRNSGNSWLESGIPTNYFSNPEGLEEGWGEWGIWFSLAEYSGEAPPSFCNIGDRTECFCPELHPQTFKILREGLTQLLNCSHWT